MRRPTKFELVINRAKALVVSAADAIDEVGCRYPLLAQSEHLNTLIQCPLSGVKRTLLFVLRMSVPGESWLTSGMVQRDLAGHTGRLPCPALEGIRERTNLAVAEQPSNLRDR